MNFSSPHRAPATGTLRSLIQETTVCPPSRGLFFGSSRITGKDALGLHEKEFAVPVAVRHPLDDFAHGLRVRPQSPVGASLLAMAASLSIKMSSSLQDISYQKRRKRPQIFKVVARKRAL
jgi:hypothetical protein